MQGPWGRVQCSCREAGAEQVQEAECEVGLTDEMELVLWNSNVGGERRVELADGWTQFKKIFGFERKAQQVFESIYWITEKWPLHHYGELLVELGSRFYLHTQTLTAFG